MTMVKCSAFSVQVYESLQKSGELEKEALAYFDDPDGADKLYYLRFLTNQARTATAQYIAEQQYDAVVNSLCMLLPRSGGMT